MACLVCDAKKCAYNENFYCCKGDIMVGGKHADKEEQTFCESFRDQSRDFFKSSLDHPSEIIHIDCEAVNCVYNAGYRCHAENVTIKGGNAEDAKNTICSTFLDRDKGK